MGTLTGHGWVLSHGHGHPLAGSQSKSDLDRTEQVAQEQFGMDLYRELIGGRRVAEYTLSTPESCRRVAGIASAATLKRSMDKVALAELLAN